MTDLFNASQTDYDGWLAQQVQDAIDDPRPSVSNEEAQRRWELQADGIRAQMVLDAQAVVEV